MGHYFLRIICLMGIGTSFFVEALVGPARFPDEWSQAALPVGHSTHALSEPASYLHSRAMQDPSAMQAPTLTITGSPHAHVDLRLAQGIGAEQSLQMHSTMQSFASAMQQISQQSGRIGEQARSILGWLYGHKWLLLGSGVVIGFCIVQGQIILLGMAIQNSGTWAVWQPALAGGASMMELGQLDLSREVVHEAYKRLISPFDPAQGCDLQRGIALFFAQIQKEFDACCRYQRWARIASALRADKLLRFDRKLLTSLPATLKKLEKIRESLIFYVVEPFFDSFKSTKHDGT